MAFLAGRDLKVRDKQARSSSVLPIVGIRTEISHVSSVNRCIGLTEECREGLADSGGGEGGLNPSAATLAEIAGSLGI